MSFCCSRNHPIQLDFLFFFVITDIIAYDYSYVHLECIWTRVCLPSIPALLGHGTQHIFNIFLAVLGLRFCMRVFCSWGEWGLHSSCSAWTSHCRAPALGRRASVVAIHRLSRPAAHGSFLDQESHLCPLHCKERFLTTGAQGKPNVLNFIQHLQLVIQCDYQFYPWPVLCKFPLLCLTEKNV